jgi:NADPH2:quinone reductase
MDGAMRAWRLERHGEPLVLREVEEPQPGTGEVLVQVATAGLNFADLLIQEGRYQDRHVLPFTPGFEFAGTVLATAAGAPAPGTRVVGFTKHGAFAERIGVPSTQLVPLPSHVSDAEAAAMPVAYGTAQLALADKARLCPGETLFVTGSAGGVGLASVELASRMGARIIASARGPERLAVADGAGAHHLIDSDAPGLKEALRALGGVDVVFDTVGGPAFDAAMRACKPDARMLIVGFASGEVPQIPANQLLVRNVSVIGLWWGGYISAAPGLLRDGLAALLAYPQDTALRPHVSHLLGFDELPGGMALLRERRATGKVVLQV